MGSGGTITFNAWSSQLSDAVSASIANTSRTQRLITHASPNFLFQKKKNLYVVNFCMGQQCQNRCRTLNHTSLSLSPTTRTHLHQSTNAGRDDDAATSEAHGVSDFTH